ncbi:unnamed protein product [Meloidogyne enterolobii]|uniref:Uncharacterized protein n=1 Tax=Meloidogyne enterolobii TaxID=390850 RepID=A0ACB0Z2Z6_MELEN
MPAIQKLLLKISTSLIGAGLVLTIIGLLSPAWQVVDIREFGTEHQHGLWLDCIRAKKHVVAVGDSYDEAPLHCMYKFDQSAALVIEKIILFIKLFILFTLNYFFLYPKQIFLSKNRTDEDEAFGETEYHRFWGWQKVVLTLILLSQLSAFVAACTGDYCVPCFPPSTFCFTISLFIAMLLSMLSDGVFFFSANRVDIRFITGKN